MKGRFVRFRDYGTKAVNSAHVMCAIHGTVPSGNRGRPVPIMLSRVTIAASRSSLQLSVPRGRMGRTRYRISAVESHTRISVWSGSSTPKSRSTPRGSMTARDGPRIARAQRTHDHVVQFGRVLHDVRVLALHAGITKRSERLCRFGEESLLEFPIHPRLGYNLRPIAGANFFLVSLDQKIDRCWIDITLLTENAFERAHAELHFR